MSLKVVQKMRLCAAVVGAGSVIALGGVTGYYMQDAYVNASGNPGGATATAVTTPPTAPATAKAVPSITGPAPLYAGEDPNTNPQAAIP